MTDTAIAAHAAPRRNQPGKVAGKLRDAIDAMVYDGLTYADAARKFDLTTRAMRMALEKPHVLAYLRQQREVLRSSMCGTNIHRLAQIRDAADNMPAVQAIKVLEQLGDEQHNRSSAPATPGLVVVINSGPAAVNADNVGVSWQSDRKAE